MKGKRRSIEIGGSGKLVGKKEECYVWLIPGSACAYASKSLCDPFLDLPLSWNVPGGHCCHQNDRARWRDQSRRDLPGVGCGYPHLYSCPVSLCCAERHEHSSRRAEEREHNRLVIAHVCSWSLE